MTKNPKFLAYLAKRDTDALYHDALSISAIRQANIEIPTEKDIKVKDDSRQGLMLEIVLVVKRIVNLRESNLSRAEQSSLFDKALALDRLLYVKHKTSLKPYLEKELGNYGR